MNTIVVTQNKRPYPQFSIDIFSWDIEEEITPFLLEGKKRNGSFCPFLVNMCFLKNAQSLIL